MSKDFDFSRSYDKIEEINEWFQREDINLDKALKKYKEGMDLIQKCKKRLEKTESEFEEIKKEYKEK